MSLIGKHFAEGEEIGFDEIAIQASDLNAWTQTFALRGNYGRRKGEHAFTKGTIAFEVPDDVEIPLAKGERATIKFGVQSDGLWVPSDRAALTQTATLHLRFAKRATLQQVFERIGQIRNFLSLAVGRPVAILSVNGFQDDYLRERPKEPMPIELLWSIRHNPTPPKKERQQHEMFFTLPEASPDISTVMKHWFAKQARLTPVFTLFFGILYHPDIFLEVRFLVFAQAVETYDYRRRRKPVELNLANRMADVLALCQTASRKIVGRTASDRDRFIKLFLDSRNYYTHYNPKLEKKAAAVQHSFC